MVILSNEDIIVWWTLSNIFVGYLQFGHLFKHIIHWILIWSTLLEFRARALIFGNARVVISTVQAKNVFLYL